MLTIPLCLHSEQLRLGLFAPGFTRQSYDLRPAHDQSVVAARFFGPAFAFADAVEPVGQFTSDFAGFAAFGL